MCFSLRFRKINKDIILYPDCCIWLRKALHRGRKNIVAKCGCKQSGERKRQRKATAGGGFCCAKQARGPAVPLLEHQWPQRSHRALPFGVQQERQQMMGHRSARGFLLGRVPPAPAFTARVARASCSSGRPTTWPTALPTARGETGRPCAP